jgi:hypothetical protein
MTIALKYLRDCGLAQNDEEAVAVENEVVTHQAGRFTRKPL